MKEPTVTNALTPATVEWLRRLFKMGKPLMMMSGDLRAGKSLVQIDLMKDLQHDR